MRTVIAILMALALTGCVTASYKSDKESFKMTSMLKKVEGLDAKRQVNGDFTILLNSTGSETDKLMELMRLIQMMTPVK